MYKTIGILAHVDAGKTSLSEQILYHTKSIRSRGRVDHKNTFLDNYQIEKKRGITVFSKFEKKSIDFAVMEKSNNIYVIPSSFIWNDVGSYEAFDELFDHWILLGLGSVGFDYIYIIPFSF